MTGKGGVGKGVPGFLTKTFEIFNGPEHNECCGWGPNGTTIVISKIDRFSKEVLPKYFKHANFQSFVRQLNMYDFHKTVQDPTHGEFVNTTEFQHQYFIQNRPDLLPSIRRKANHKPARVAAPMGDDEQEDHEVQERFEGKISQVERASPPKQKKSKKSAGCDSLIPMELVHESGAVLKELREQQRQRQGFERRMEQRMREIESENQMLKNLYTENQHKTNVMQQRMGKLLHTIYTALNPNGSSQSTLGIAPNSMNMSSLNNMISLNSSMNMGGMGLSSIELEYDPTLFPTVPPGEDITYLPTHPPSSSNTLQLANPSSHPDSDPAYDYRPSGSHLLNGTAEDATGPLFENLTSLDSIGGLLGSSGGFSPPAYARFSSATIGDGNGSGSAVPLGGYPDATEVNMDTGGGQAVEEVGAGVATRLGSVIGTIQEGTSAQEDEGVPLTRKATIFDGSRAMSDDGGGEETCRGSKRENAGGKHAHTGEMKKIKTEGKTDGKTEGKELEQQRTRKELNEVHYLLSKNEDAALTRLDSLEVSIATILDNIDS